MVVRLIWIDQKMHMVWHEHVGPERNVEFRTRVIYGVGEPLAGAFGLKKGVAAKAGERQFMHVSRLVGRRPTHAPMSPVHKVILAGSPGSEYRPRPRSIHRSWFTRGRGLYSDPGCPALDRIRPTHAPMSLVSK